MLQTSFRKSDQTWAWQPKQISIGSSFMSNSQAAFITLHVSVTKATVLFSRLCLRRTSRVLSATKLAASKQRILCSECFEALKMLKNRLQQIRARIGIHNFGLARHDDSPVTCSVLAVVISMKYDAPGIAAW